ncbi:MAG: lysophospholipid acyltransferase family protein [Candidatus Cloacimonetes bacterium]|nr:lysophospholipid acyltransferase family protein [Candidatus Cloacimonadota bacterium]
MSLSKLGFWLEKYLAAAFVLLLGATWRIRQIEPRFGERHLFISWHRNIIPSAYARRGEGIAVLISGSKDGQLAAGPVEALGYLPIRGSSTRGGGKAMRQIIRASRTRAINMIPDGPKGPPCVVKDGVVWASYFTGLSIVPIAVEVDRTWRLNTWDRMLIPKPFARITLRYGEPIPAPSKDEVQNTLDTVCRVMKEMNGKSDCATQRQ